MHVLLPALAVICSLPLERPFIIFLLHTVVRWKGEPFGIGALSVLGCLITPTLLWLLCSSDKQMLTGSSKAVGTQKSFAVDYFQVLLSSQDIASGSKAVWKADPWWHTETRGAYFYLLVHYSRGNKPKLLKFLNLLCWYSKGSSCCSFKIPFNWKWTVVWIFLRHNEVDYWYAPCVPD